MSAGRPPTLNASSQSFFSLNLNITDQGSVSQRPPVQPTLFSSAPPLFLSIPPRLPPSVQPKFSADFPTAFRPPVIYSSTSQQSTGVVSPPLIHDQEDGSLIFSPSATPPAPQIPPTFNSLSPPPSPVPETENFPTLPDSATIPSTFTIVTAPHFVGMTTVSETLPARVEREVVPETAASTSSFPPPPRSLRTTLPPLAKVTFNFEVERVIANIPTPSASFRGL
ncbi:leucine-rich repeat extensin-like protein 3 [Folsomia candida]|uniref:leucine-rich repeat extensin-like protein 3 n=1 Tax=Folsomia candida TaxID=158441 RepID=UPI001604B4F9|nr:leucine-rich repeat extensin-like protein 3 [Folsomia candida]